MYCHAMLVTSIDAMRQRERLRVALCFTQACRCDAAPLRRRRGTGKRGELRDGLARTPQPRYHVYDMLMLLFCAALSYMFAATPL